MSRTAVKTSFRPQSIAADCGTLHHKNAVQNEAFEENSRCSQIAPPGFAAAAAAAAVAVADAGAHTPTPRSAAAAAEIAAARAGIRPATPWPTGAASAGAAAGNDRRPATPWSTYATQPYIQPMMGGNSSMTQAYHPSMTLHYMPGHVNLLPFGQGHGAPTQTTTRMPPPQTLPTWPPGRCERPPSAAAALAGAATTPTDATAALAGAAATPTAAATTAATSLGGTNHQMRTK